MKLSHATLDEVSSFIRNGASIKQSKIARGLPVTRIETIADGTVNLDKCGYADLTENDYKNYRLKSGDILVSHINSEKHLGKSAIFDSERDDIIHGMNLLCIRPLKEKVHPKYFFYYLSSPSFLNQIPKITKKSVNQASFTVTSFKSLQIPLPSLDEQKRIAAILGKADAIRRKRQQAIQLADDFLRSVFLDMFGDPVTNPKGWEVKKLGDCLHFLTSGSRGWAKYYSETGSKFIRIMNVGRGKLLLNDMAYVTPPKTKEAERTRVREQDVLLSITADLGRAAVVDKELEGSFINQHLAILRPDSAMINSKFLAKLLSSSSALVQFTAANKSAVKAGLNFTDIREFKLVVPPVTLQKKFELVTNMVEKSIRKVNSAAYEKESLFYSLSQKAFSGEL